MIDGAFARLNAHLLNTTNMGDNQLVSIVGSMEATDGTTITLTTSDGQSLIWSVNGDIDFAKGKIVEMMGAKNAETGGMEAFVARELGDDFDMQLYDDFLTKVLHGRHQDLFIQTE